MRHVTLVSITSLLLVVCLGADQAGGRLGRAVNFIDRNDVDGLRRVLKEDPALVRQTEAGMLPHWRWTLLHAATAGPSVIGIVSALVDAGADVNVKDNEGNTPLHFAMKRMGAREKLPLQDYEAVIKLLLEKKADVHAVNVGGATPLHTASAFRAAPAGVELLIQAGANVNQKAPESYGGWTPLHGAAARNSADIITVLLKHGADRTAKDAKGMTPLQVAEQGGFTEAARVLRTPQS
jgi:cytohesin